MQTIAAIAARVPCQILLIVAIAAAGCGEGFDERSDATVDATAVAATVNGVVIARDEVAAYMANHVPRQQALDQLINLELVVQAARAAHIVVPAKEIDDAYAEIKRQNHLVDDAAMANVLARYGYTVARYRVELERELLKLHAINMIVAPTVAANADAKARHAELDAKAGAWIAQLRQHAVIDIAVDSKLSAR